MKITLLNDTAIKSHVGCLAVSNAHAKLLGDQGHQVVARYFVNELRSHRRDSVHATVLALQRNERLIADVRRSDAVIINGEGTIHHNGGIEYVAAMEIAKAERRPVFLVNSLYQAMDFGAETLRSIDGVYMRDALSMEYAKSLQIDCHLHPDSIIHAQFTSTPSRNFMGQIVFSDWVKSNTEVIGANVTDLMRNREDFSFWPLHDTDSRRNWQHAVATIRTASLLVSSRHHALYLALLAGIPILPVSTKSWKLEGLLKMVGLRIVAVSSGDIARNLGEPIHRDQAAIDAARDRLLSFGPPPWVLSLGKGSSSTAATELETLKTDLARKQQEVTQDRIFCLLRRQGEIGTELSKLGHTKKSYWRRVTSLLR